MGKYITSVKEYRAALKTEGIDPGRLGIALKRDDELDQVRRTWNATYDKAGVYVREYEWVKAFQYLNKKSIFAIPFNIKIPRNYKRVMLKDAKDFRKGFVKKRDEFLKAWRYYQAMQARRSSSRASSKSGDEEINPLVIDPYDTRNPFREAPREGLAYMVRQVELSIDKSLQEYVKRGTPIVARLARADRWRKMEWVLQEFLKSYDNTIDEIRKLSNYRKIQDWKTFLTSSKRLFRAIRQGFPISDALEQRLEFLNKEMLRLNEANDTRRSRRSLPFKLRF